MRLLEALGANLVKIADLFKAPSFPQFHPIEEKNLFRSKDGPGWSHSQVQRMARKKRNQAKNRKAQR